MKNNVLELAVFGGPPTFQDKLHVGRPNIGNIDRLLAHIKDILNNRWLTNNGPYVQEFEKKIAEFVGVKHCIAMCNATIALEIAIRAIGMRDEVIVPSSTFVATAHALQWQEITPVFCDIDSSTCNIDETRIEEMITPRTSGIIGVHLWGRPCNIEALTEIASRRGLHLLFDSAHAFGCTYKGRMIGGFGSAEVFSFHATKFMNTFEGGAVVTNDDVLASKIRLMKNFGFDGYDNVIYIGTNGKMHEVTAAMGLISLESLDEFINANYHNYEHYKSKINDIRGISVLQYDNNEKSNYQYIIIEIDEDITNITRDQIVMILHAENVLVRRYFYPGCHRMEPYRSLFPHAGLLLPKTEDFLSKVISMPTGMSVAVEDIDEICKLIHFIVENGVEIRGKLSK